MKRFLGFCSVFFSVTFFGFAQAKTGASEIWNKALDLENSVKAIEYIEKNIGNAAEDSDKRSLYAVKGMLEEENFLFADAVQSYVKAASISAMDADRMPKFSSEQLVLNAVRGCLCSGEFDMAEEYLASQISASKNERIRAFVNLYQQWAALGKCKELEDAGDIRLLMQTYSKMQSMASVRKEVLFTLWYVWNDLDAASELKSKFPSSPESHLVKGKANLGMNPFWFFIPHESH